MPIVRSHWFTKGGILGCLAASLLTLAGCGGSSESSSSADDGTGDIKVGLYVSLTGAQATFGTSSKKGVDLAVSQINESGGINGRNIRIIEYDTRGNSQETGNVVTRLIERDRVTAIIGEVASSLSFVGGRLAQERGVPMITHASTNDEVTNIGNMVHRVCFIDSFQGYVGAKFLKEDLGIDRTAVLFDQAQAYSTGLKDEFIRWYEQMGGTVTTVQAYEGGAQDFNTLLNNIRNSNPGAIYIPGYYNDVAAIALQARRLGINLPMMGGDGWDSEVLVETAGAAVEGAYYSNHYAADDPRPEVVAFIETFRARYNETPDAMATLGYDGTMILADAMRRAASLSPNDLAAAIAATKDFPAVTGTISLDEKRNATKPAIVVQIKDGKPVFAASIEPPSAQ